MSSRFDLDKALAAWRRPFEHDRTFSDDDLEELESGLRDRIDALVAAGASQEAAFAEAMQRMGGYGTAEAEYRKVYWGKVRRGHRLRSELTWRLSMLKNYLKVAFRALRRQRGYALLNVAGLAVGLASCLFMALYVWGELAVDRFHNGADRVFRVVQETPGGSSAQTAGAHASLLAQSAAGVEATVRIVPWERTLTLGSDRASFAEPDFAYADPSIFDVFSLPLVAGDPLTALAGPGTAVLTRAAAEKYFGTADPMGRTLVMTDEYSEPSEIPLVVTGILADLPGRSHLALGVLSSAATLESQYGPLDKLDWPGLYTYARLADGADREAAAERATAALAARLPSGAGPSIRLQALTKVYLNPQDRNEWGVSGSRDMVLGLVAIALTVLLLACTNFTTLALARATTRIREIGVRRAMGAQRSEVVAQLLADALLLTAAALVLAVGLVALAMPLVSDAIGQPLNPTAGSWGALALAFAGLLTLTGIVAGISPALFLARQHPALAVQGRVEGASSADRLRSGLVVLQFGTSAVLVVTALVIHRQLDYVNRLDPGFDAERVVAVAADDARRSFEPLHDALAAEPGVAAVSASNGLPGLQEVQADMVARAEGRDEEGAPVHVQAVGPGFFDLMGVALEAGRYPEDALVEAGAPLPLVLNRAAAGVLGWEPEEAVGRRVRVVQPGNEANNPGLDGSVVAIAADFHHASARSGVPPAVYYPARSADVPGLYVVSHILVRLAPGAPPDALTRVEAAWERTVPGHPFEATLLSQEIRAQYERDLRLGRTVGLFAGLALVVACLGLFGLAAFAAEQRTKEIGVRKVLGASIPSIIRLLSVDFLKLIQIAFVIALPASYFAMNAWLSGFAYRIDIGPGVFVLTGLLVLGIALATVSYQAVRAALADPVKSLRYE